MSEASSYSDPQISRLSAREHIRLRPKMYFGSVDQRALHQMVFEVLNDPVEEAFLGKCDHIWLTLHANEVITIRDNSQGLPVRLLNSGKRLLEMIMTETGTRRIRGQYTVTGGLMGVGLNAVNALSSECTVEVARDEFLWRQTYHEGIPQTDVLQVRPLETGEATGTSITFRPDFTILERNPFSDAIIRERVRELAYLLPGLKITLCDERGQTTQQEDFHFPNGLADYLCDLNAGRPTLHPPLTGSAEWTIRPDARGEYTIHVDVALQYTDTMDTTLVGYVNTVKTSAGLHTETVPFALASLLRHWKTTELAGQVSLEDCQPGLTAVVSVKHPHPSFESLTRVELLDYDVVGIIFGAVHAALQSPAYQEAHKSLLEKVLANYYALHTL